MRTFAQKPKATQETMSAKVTIPGRAPLGQNRDVNSILHSQRTIGNQAVQRLLEANTGDVKGDSTTMGRGCFGHDFSQIPVHAPSPIRIHPKLAVNTPGDVYEQEADLISEQVMRMSEPQLQRACTCGGGCPKCQTEQLGQEHERLQAKRVGSSDLGQAAALPIVNEVLRSPGQPLDPATRGFMESRFGHDFSRVRVHRDGNAAESAKSIDALAYTSGNHIAFADGQYSLTTEGGKRLLAHELVHTMQQGNNILYRKIDFTEPKPILADPIPLVLSGNILGITLPGLNGTLLPKTATKKAYKEAVFKALQPQTFKFSATQNGMIGKVDPNKFSINFFAEVRAITEPDKDKWSGLYLVSLLRNPPSVCAEKGDSRIPIEMKGKPNSTALYKKVLAHEQEHVSDFKNLLTKELKPYHDFLIGLTGTGKTEKECVEDIFKQVGSKDALAAQDFVEKWSGAVQVYDKVGGTHHSKFDTKFDATKCTKIQITEKL